MRPLIGLTTWRSPRPPNRFHYAVSSEYVAAVEEVGGIAVTLPAQPKALSEVIAALDALILTGGGDVDPVHYGQSLHPATRSIDPDRDRFELDLTRMAVEHGLPLLGICRGIQVLNVALGGTLIQDVPDQVPAALVHQTPEDAPIAIHHVRLQPNSRLAALIQCTDLLTNSAHHQAIQSLAPALRSVGWSQDGVVEAVESTDQAFVVGVQWHPELLFRDAATHRRLFAGLVEACANRA
ncbi:MAG: gamma-glutamyl-gamma-aminobutyrate hydrolase family protein [Anaerolineae bacterium]